MEESLLEVAAVIDRFAGLARRLDLTSGEMTALTGLPEIPDSRMVLNKDAETRIRLLCDLEFALGRVLPDDGLSSWLRRTAFGQSPLQFLATGPESMRAMLCAARSLAEPGGSTLT